MSGTTVPRVNEIKDLGVIFNSSLTFNSHIEYISKKATAALNFARRQAQFFDKDILKLLFMLLVRSNLEFACSIWSPYLPTHKGSIESVQKQMVILLNGDDKKIREGIFDLGPYNDRCESVGLCSLARRRANAMILFIHAIIIGRFKSPALRSQLSLNTGVRSLRNPEFIRFKTYNKDYSTFQPFNNACRAFNFAALYIDPTLPHYEFRKRLLRLSDTQLGPWASPTATPK